MLIPVPQHTSAHLAHVNTAPPPHPPKPVPGHQSSETLPLSAKHEQDCPRVTTNWRRAHALARGLNFALYAIRRPVHVAVWYLHGVWEVWDDEDGDGDVHLQITQKGPPQRSTGWMVVGR